MTAGCTADFALAFFLPIENRHLPQSIRFHARCGKCEYCSHLVCGEDMYLKRSKDDWEDTTDAAFDSRSSSVLPIVEVVTGHTDSGFLTPN